MYTVQRRSQNCISLLVSIEFGLLIPSNFTLALDWMVSYIWLCRLCWFGMMFGEFLSSWLYAALAAERFVALFYPLRHRSLFTVLSTKYILSGVSVFSFVLAFVSAIFAQISELPIGLYCNGEFLVGQSIEGIIAYLLDSILSNFVPLMASVIFTSFLLYKLYSIRLNRRSLGVMTNEISNNQLSATLTIVIFMCVDLAVYIPLTVCAGAAFIFQNISDHNSNLYYFPLFMAATAYSLTTIKRTFNLLIYLVRIPQLRARLCCRRLIR